MLQAESMADLVDDGGEGVIAVELGGSRRAVLAEEHVAGGIGDLAIDLLGKVGVRASLVARQTAGTGDPEGRVRRETEVEDDAGIGGNEIEADAGHRLLFGRARLEDREAGLILILGGILAGVGREEVGEPCRRRVARRIRRPHVVGQERPEIGIDDRGGSKVAGIVAALGG